MEFKPTKQQSEAIRSRGSVLVSAAAGSGKTAVLVERVISRLCDSQAPIDADRLLIVTFTNAAATEMRRRIEARLNEECAKQPGNRHLMKQQMLLSGASICTIDSFCIGLIRNHFNVLGISPEFKIAEGSVLSDIKQTVISGLFEEQYELGDEGFLRLLRALGSDYGDGTAVSAVMKLYEFSSSMPFPEKWLLKMRDMYLLNDERCNPWANYVLDKMGADLKTLTQNLKQIIRELEFDEVLRDKYTDPLSMFLNQLSDLLSFAFDKDWDGLYHCLQGVSFVSLPAIRKPCDIALKERAQELKKSLQSFIEGMCKIVKSDLAGTLIEVKKVSEFIDKLVILTTEFDRRLFLELNSRGLLTFHYTEQLALQLLGSYDGEKIVESDIAADIAELYDEILVDEYQDTNNLQDALFHILSGGGNRLFLVGDVKQSIYAFRGANPENFISKKANCLPFSEELTENQSKKIILGNNFRSRKGICDYINFFFERLMTGEFGAIEYGEEERLYPMADFPGNEDTAVELHLIEKGTAEEHATVYEARHIAKFIRDSMERPPFLRNKEGGLRSAEYCDFTILLRSPTGRAETYLSELKKSGIPAALGNSDFFETVEIRTILSLLRVVNNPSDSISLLAVMMSPIFGFSADDVAEIRMEDKKRSLYSCVLLAAGKENVDCNRLLKDIKQFRTLSATRPVGLFLSSLLDITGYREIVLSMDDGLRRRENLYLLEDYAAGYEGDADCNLSGFLRYMDRLSENGIKANANFGNDNVVKIMSIHSSKGLQFPICILAYSSSNFNMTDSNENLVFNDKFGIGLRYIDEERGVKVTTLPRSAISMENRRKRLEEELRLVYVAMTRAEEKLVLLLSEKNIGTVLAKAVNQISSEEHEGFVLSSSLSESARGYDDWMLVTALLHPDGTVLRELGGGEQIFPVKTDGNIKIQIVDPILEENVGIVDNQERALPSRELIAKLEARFQYRYPFERLREIEAKTSVSALVKKEAERDFSFTARPAFLSKAGLSPAARGTAAHKFMEFADYAAAKEDVTAEIDRLLEWEYLTEAEANSIDHAAFRSFFKSNLYHRLAASDTVKREQRFLLELSAKEVEPSLPPELADEMVVVQGAVDCLFFEDNEIVLLDFKTDRTNDENRLLELYSEQLRLYARACTSLYGKPVKNCYLYSLHMKREIEIKL